MNSLSEPLGGFCGLAFDLDGTLLRSDHTISPRLGVQLRDLSERGMPIAILSARPPRSVLNIAAHLQLQGRMVTLNGALIVHTNGEILESETVLPQVVRSFQQIIMGFPRTTAHYYSGLNWFVYGDNSWVQKEASIVGFHPTVLSPDVAIEDFSKVLMTGPEADINALELALAESLPEISALRSKPEYLEVTKRDVTKAYGLEMVATSWGLAAADFIVFGDADNDLPLMERAGMGVAMGNGTAVLKEAASVVIGTNDEESISEFIEEMLTSGRLGFPQQPDPQRQSANRVPPTNGLEHDTPVD